MTMDTAFTETKGQNYIQLVTFSVGAEEFGVDILRVQEINRMMAISKVPNSPPFVEGVINLRGKVIPVIDMRLRFGMPATGVTAHTRIIVMDLQDRITGFVVDAVREVLRMDASSLEATPEIVASISEDYLKGIGRLPDRLLLLLDLDKLLTESEKGALSGL